ncbi:MAG: hypothetical protein IPO81_26510 [Kouleothrix sp.]|nr:hypothetical protein [Kouleothrix sp.]
MHWWHWRRAHVLETWVRSLIGARPYHVAYKTGSGSYVNLRTKEITIDPTMADGWGGDSLLPFVWRGRTVRTLAALQYRISRAMARHEAGHVLFTDDYSVAGELHAWLTNALEDGRMERLTGRYYLPARADFDALGTLLWQKKPPRLHDDQPAGPAAERLPVLALGLPAPDRHPASLALGQ